MSTSDNLPPSSGTPNSPADEQRLDRLYNRMNSSLEPVNSLEPDKSLEPHKSPESSSPTDLDDLIRAAAKAPLQTVASGAWHWQQRAGWATAAAVVLTSALFLALPESAPDRASSAQGTPAQPTVVTTPVALDADIAAPVTPDISSELAIDTPVEISKPAMGSFTAQSRTLKVDDAAPALNVQVPEVMPEMEALVEMDALAEAQMMTEQEAIARVGDADQMADLASAAQPKAGLIASPQPKIAARQARSKVASSAQQSAPKWSTSPECNTLIKGLIRRICTVPGSTTSYLLHPDTTADCAPLRLDEQPSRPTPRADSTTNEFVYAVGSRRFSATCNNGEWVVQSLARGR